MDDLIAEIEISSDEIDFVTVRAPKRVSDWLVTYVTTYKNDQKALQEQQELILESRKMWWSTRNWQGFIKLSEALLDVSLQKIKSSKDEVLFDYIQQIYVAEQLGNGVGLAATYLELAKDQYYDGKDSLYREIEMDRFVEIWKLIQYACLLEPNNIEIRYHIIGLMNQSNESGRSEVFREINKALDIDIAHATTLSSSRPPRFYYEYIIDVAERLKPHWKEDDLRMVIDILKMGDNKGILPHSLQQVLQTFDKNPDLFAVESEVAEKLQKVKDKFRSIRALFLQGEKLFLEGRYNEAKMCFEDVIRHDRSYVEPHYYLGKILINNNDFENAEKEFRAAINLKPELALYHFELGVVLNHQRKIAEAMDVFKKAIELNPFLEEADHALAMAKASLPSKQNRGGQ
jgi:tetratricopeptide (TPR) repeat protein